jgi:hypothetical protein
VTGQTTACLIFLLPGIRLVIYKKGAHFEVELVMQDQSGKTIGAVGIVFAYQKGKEAEFQKNAEQIRDEMRKQTPSLAKLFEPAE